MLINSGVSTNARCFIHWPQRWKRKEMIWSVIYLNPSTGCLFLWPTVTQISKIGLVCQNLSPHLKRLQILIFWAIFFLFVWPTGLSASSTKTKSCFHRLAALHRIYESGESHFLTRAWTLTTRVEYFIHQSIRWPWSTHTSYHHSLPLLYSPGLSLPLAASICSESSPWWDQMWDLARF